MIRLPGRPRSPRSPLGPTVPLQYLQMQKNGIWSVGGGTGAFSSMSQIVVSGMGGKGGLLTPNILGMLGPSELLPWCGNGGPVGGIIRGPLRASGGHDGIPFG